MYLVWCELWADLDKQDQSGWSGEICEVWANIDTGGLFGFCLAPGNTSRRMVRNTFQFISNTSTVTTIQIREYSIEQ